MKIVIGLGNPGRRYEATPHNLGFEVIGELARRWCFSGRTGRAGEAEVFEGHADIHPVLLVRPQTFMNRSGAVVAQLVRQREFTPEELLIVVDDVNLPIGRLRIRSGGGHGGHNGLRSIIERTGTREFSRLRIGIRPPWEVADLTAYVLTRPPASQQQQLAEMALLGADAVEHWLHHGTAGTAERYNADRRFEAAEDEPGGEAEQPE